MMKVRTFLLLTIALLFPVFISSTMALTWEPYYSFSEFHALGGYVGIEPNTSNPLPTGHWSSEHETDEGFGTTSVAGGQAWWASDGSPITLLSPSSQGWGEVTANPEAGTISSRSGAHHTQTGNQVSWWVELIPGVEFEYMPFTWGEGSAYGYMRMLWEVGTDGTLGSGDSVSLLGDLDVTGVFDDEDDMTMRATVMVNQVGNAYWLDSSEYINYSFLEDIILHDDDALNSMLWFENESRHSDTSDDVDINLSSFMDVSVGDIILMEVMLETTATLPNDGIGRDIWADFSNTLNASLLSSTQGALLTPYGTAGDNGNVPIPEPSTVLLLGSGLVGLSWYRRKRRKA